MSNAIAQGQHANVTPPVRDQIMCVTLDATSRRYDLGAAALDPWFANQKIEQGGEQFLTLFADVIFYFFMSPDNTGTADQTAATVAGGAPAFVANGCALVPANTEKRIRIDRTRHRFLVVKGSGAGTLRLQVSSDSSARR